MGVENIVAGHGVGIALLGMLVVFGGLVLVSLYLAALPRALGWAGWAVRRTPARSEAVKTVILDRDSTSPDIDADLLVAIAYVLQAERDREQLDHQRITLRDAGEQRVWTAMGKMRTLATRM